MKKFITFISLFCCCFYCESKEPSAKAVQQASEYIESEVKLVNDNIVGKKMDSITTLIGCTFDGKKVTYYYEIDETQTTIADIKKSGNVKLMKSMANDLWNGSNPSLKEVKKSLKTLGGHVTFYYEGTLTHDTITFDINIK